MVPDILEECKATPKPEEEVKLEEEEEEIVKSRLEELKSSLGLRGDGVFCDFTAWHNENHSRGVQSPIGGGDG